MIGSVISHYKILEKLGEGGMGVVYRAEDTMLKRTVALKFLPSELTRDAEAKERFIHEAQAASALDHNNICNIHEIGGTPDGQVFIAMAYYEGDTLKKKIEHGPLKIDEALEIAVQCAQGLAKAHEKRIVHRDIKPANVMVTADGVVKIVDFGLAKLSGQTNLTKAGSTLGTSAYMSPEQARGEQVDARTDVWSLGVLVYEMITGVRAFKAEYENAVMYSILNAEPEPITSLRTGVPMELERIVNKCMEKNLAERYQHLDDLLADLRSFKRKLETGETPLRAVVPKQTMRRALVVYGSMAIIVALIVGIIYVLLPTSEVLDSIAVLPLDNLSGDPGQEFFSDGMTDALITELQKIRSLRVISRTSVKQYKGTMKTIPEIARELNVKAVVEGSVLRDADNVRINVQLIQASPEKHLWANAFDRNMRNILALQSEVARGIAQEIEIKITPQERLEIARSRLVNAHAYEVFLRGRYYSDRRTEESLRKSIEYFERAIEIDSNYALAYAGVADSYNLLARYGYVFPKEGYLKAKAAARRALELDNTLAEAYTSQAFLNWYYEFDPQAAENNFKRAIELNPSYETAHHWYALCLSSLGRHDEAIREITRARELDPLSLIINTNVAYAHYFAGEYDKAVEQFCRTIEMDSTFGLAHLRLGLTYEELGNLNEGIVELQKAMQFAEGTTEAITGLGHAYAVAGREKDARKILRGLITMRGKRYVSPYGIAVVYAGLSEKDEAFQWLEKAAGEHDSWLAWIMIDPRLAPIRSETRFKTLIKKIGSLE
ncbi:MAG: protein kinase [Ignavibacteria bacterium]|nr:protein kinase [Ignavibacteria bacterium]